MHTSTSHVSIFLGALVLIGTGACGSSSSSGAGGSATSTTTTTGATGGSGTGGSGTGGTATGGSTGSGGALSCQDQCVADHMEGAKKFQGYEIQECGCAAASPCVADCTAECADPTKFAAGTPCGNCIGGEEAKGLASDCTKKAGLTDCVGDATCAPFATCAAACP